MTVLTIVLAVGMVLCGIALLAWGLLRARWVPGGVAIVRARYADGDTHLLVEDTYHWWSSDEDSRSLRVEDSPVVYSRVPLPLDQGSLLVYAYCAPLIVMVAWAGEGFSRALVLGGAGGAVPLYILSQYDAQVDVMDMSARSIEISKRYFLADYVGSDRLTFLHAEASVGVEQLSGPYDFIFCDLFSGDTLAEVVYSAPFVQALHRLTGPSGLLVINGGSIPTEKLRLLLGHLLGTYGHAWAMMLDDPIILAAREPMPDIDALMRAEGVIPLYPSALDHITPEA